MIEIAKAKEAKFYLEADLEWLNRQLDDERAKGFQEWVDKLDFGVPKNLAAEVAAYKEQMAPYFDPLLALRDKLQAESVAVDETIARTTIEVSDEVKKYVREEEPEEPIEPEKPIKEEGELIVKK